MKMRTRSFIGVGVAAFCVLACIRSPLTAEDMGLDFWHVGELEKQIASGERRHAELERSGQVVMERIRLRGMILDNLLAEKVTFDEAARGFMALSLTDRYVTAHLKNAYPRGTDLDRACRQIVKHLAGYHKPGSYELSVMLRCELSARRPDLAW